jgi:hypothetical protein
MTTSDKWTGPLADCTVSRGVIPSQKGTETERTKPSLALITLASRLSAAPDVLSRSLAGQAVILNSKTGQYYQLDAVGARMWECLTKQRRVELAYRELLAEYDASEDCLREDLLSFIQELVADGLLQVDQS